MKDLLRAGGHLSYLVGGISVPCPAAVGVHVTCPEPVSAPVDDEVPVCPVSADGDCWFCG
jgi:hypothetical protein